MAARIELTLPRTRGFWHVLLGFSGVTLGLLALFGMAAAQSPPPTDEPGPEERSAVDLRTEALARSGLLEAELRELRAHPWAGHYRNPGRFAGQLSLAPGAGFTLYRGSHNRSCSGWRAVGKVVEAGSNQLRLEVELVCETTDQGESDYQWWTEEILYLVPWGELTFTVPSSFIERFYLLVNDGYTYPGHLFARASGAAPEYGLTRPEGMPEVLPGFEKLVLTQPVHDVLGGPVRWSRNPDARPGDPRDHEALYAVGVGRNQGLADGMHLFLGGEHLWAGRRGTLERVGPTSACLRFRGLRRDQQVLAERAIGAPVSTLHPEATRRAPQAAHSTRESTRAGYQP